MRSPVPTVRPGAVWEGVVTLPEVGDPLGVAVLCSGNLIHECTLIRYADPLEPRRSRTVVWASLTGQGLETLKGKARSKTAPKMPSPVNNDGRALWNGQTLTGGRATKACSFPGVTVTWEPTSTDEALLAVCSTDGETDPLGLLDVLVQLGLTSGPADADELENRWLTGHLDAYRATPRPVADLISEVASWLGYRSSAELVVADSWDPEPHGGHGWHTWNRLNPANPGPLEILSGMVLVHRVTGSNRPGGGIVDVFVNGGVLQSPARRRLSGVSIGAGLSAVTGSDEVGLHDRVWCELAESWPDNIGPVLVWDDPLRLLTRLDWLALPPRHVDLAMGRHHSVRRSWRTEATGSVEATAAMGDGTEIVFRNGLDLLGGEAPTRIICRNHHERRDLLEVLAAKSISHLAGVPVDKVVKHRNGAWAR